MWHKESQEPPVGAVYIRRSSRMQQNNFSRETQMRAITKECQRRNLPPPILYEDDECSARGEQIA